MTLANDQLRDAVQTIPAGTWVVGVSGGADSVALLLAMHLYRPDVRLIVAHLDHQSRGAESDADREFVAALGRSLGITVCVHLLESYTEIRHPNLEARYRAARFAMFREVATEHAAAGVLLAHHADDRAETALMRLLRGGEYTSLEALRTEAMIDGLVVRRPLLSVRRTMVEAFLRERDQPWREDASNRSAMFARNRVRMLLQARPAMVLALLKFVDAAGELRRWVDTNAPLLPSVVSLTAIADLPDLLARRSLRQWLSSEGVETGDVLPAQIDQLISLARDASVSPTVNLPGGVIARRHRTQLRIERGNGVDTKRG